MTRSGSNGALKKASIEPVAERQSEYSGPALDEARRMGVTYKAIRAETMEILRESMAENLPSDCLLDRLLKI